MMTMQSTKLPQTPSDWIKEIAEAYHDAFEAKPFGIFVGQKITGKDLFHMTPYICLKFRRIKRTKANVNKATEAMLSSYVVTEDQSDDIFANPYITFSFCYLSSHYGLGLLTDDEVRDIMVYLEENYIALTETIEEIIKKKNG